MSEKQLRVDVVSDFICPWCHVGDARLQVALDTFAAKHPEVSISLGWLPFFLDAETPPEGYPYQAYMERKFGGAAAVAAMQDRLREAGAESGVTFAFDRIDLRPSTLKAHRLVTRLQGTELPTAQLATLVQGLFEAYFREGADLGDTDVLLERVAAAGIEVPGLGGWLDGDEGAEAVMALYQQVLRIGVEGVPFYIFDRRLAVSGAQPPELLINAMEEALAGED